MNFFKVKSNEDFIFKFVMLFSFFLMCFVLIFVNYNSEYIFDNKEGLKVKNVTNQVKNKATGDKDKKQKNNKGNKDDEENIEEIDDNYDEFYDSKGNLKENESKTKYLDVVNKLFSSNDGNRERSIERIEWFRNFNKARILFFLQNSAITSIPVYNELSDRLEINEMFESGEIDKLIASFPLTEAEYNSGQSSNNSNNSNYSNDSNVSSDSTTSEGSFFGGFSFF